MNKLKKFIPVIILLFVFTFSLPVSVSGNAPEPAGYLTVTLSNLPDDAVYADLLIEIEHKDPNFIDFQPNIFADSVSEAEEIVDYSRDGYRSFTFHYKNSKSNIKIEHFYDDLFYVDFCDGSEYQAYLTQYEDLRSNYKNIKIAILDKDFNIITVSEATQLPEENNAFIFDGEIYQDFDVNSLDFDTQINPYFVGFVGFFSILVILLSIGMEIVVALLFKFKGKQLLTILIVNACSQIIMRVLYLVLQFVFLTETIILEVLVYCVEFIIYRKCFKESSTARIVCYTIIANSLSLLGGIFLDSYLLV